MIFTFYSYKGGVGRSMALANVARWLSLQGLRVTMIDWDLEAPGLESFFFQGDQLHEVRDQLGLIDMLVSYRRLFPRIRETLRGAAGNDADAQATLQRKVDTLESVLPPLQTSLHGLHDMGHSVGEGGALNLLSAGWRAGDKFAAYAQAVQEFDWDEFYLGYEGQAYFEWMRRQLLAPTCSDVVLIDSRTGVTEMGGVCTRQLADAVFTFSAPNLQNLEGIVSMAASFIRDDVKAQRGRHVDVVMVPTRVDNFNETRINHFMRGFEAASDAFTPAVFRTLKTRFWNLRIPYTPGYAYQERLAIGDSDSDKDLEEAYKRVTAHLAVLAPPQTRLRRRLGAEIERVFGRLLPTVFVTYAHDDRAIADDVRKRLEAANISVWPDPSDAVGGPGDWRQAVGGILEQTRFLVVVVSAASAQSEWIRNACRYARQLGVCVVPISAGPVSGDVLTALPGWMRSIQISDINREWPRVVSWVGGPHSATRVPLMAPELPDGHVPRPETTERLASLLLGETVRRAAVVGLPGSGKSTLAAEFCRREDVESAFHDGIIWVRATEDADPKLEMQKALAALTGESVEFTDARDARAQLERRLSNHRFLIVLDDAWSAEILALFPLEIPGCRYLVTTCDRAVALRAEAVPVEVGALTEDELAAMLRQPSSSLTGEVGEFLRRLAVFPQALRIAAAALTNGKTLAETDPATIADVLLTHVGPKVVKAFRKEVLGRLDEDSRERLVVLTFAGGDSAVERVELAPLWGTDPPTVARTLSRLEDLSTVEVDAHRVRVPPWVRYLVAACYPDRDLNKQLETAFGRLDTQQQQTARQIFCRLVRFKEAVNGASVEPQTVSTSMLTSAQTALLKLLVDMNMVKLGSSAAGHWVALADESASRQWRRLREWIRADEEFLLWRQRLERYVGDWRRTSDDGALLSGALLDEANRWLATRRQELCADEVGYIERSSRGRPGTGTFAPIAMPAPIPAAAPAAVERDWRVAGIAAAVLIVAALGSTTLFLRSAAPTEATAPPPNIHAEILQADLLAERGDLPAAVKAYTAVLSVAGNDPSVYYKRGTAYARNPGDLDKALADFDRAVEIDPNRADVLAERASVRLQKGDVKGALQDLTSAIDRDPTNALLYANRASAYEAARKPEQALSDYSRAIELDQAISSAYFRRAGLYEAEGQREKAIDDLRKVVALNADATSVRAAQARLERLGQPRETQTPTQTTVFLHYADTNDREVMGKLRASLTGAGYRVLGIQYVEGARTAGDVRYVPQDVRMAANIATLVERGLADAGYDVPMSPIALNMPQAKAGRIEVWVPSLSAPTLRQQAVKKK
jgi:tetratricopeptide (TPR) repeat protein